MNKKMLLTGLMVIVLVSIGLAQINPAPQCSNDKECETGGFCEKGNCVKRIEEPNTDMNTLIKQRMETLIESSEDAKQYYYENGKMPEVTKTEVEQFKGTNTILVTTYYDNGTKATTINTKQNITNTISLNN